MAFKCFYFERSHPFFPANLLESCLHDSKDWLALSFLSFYEKKTKELVKKHETAAFLLLFYNYFIRLTSSVVACMCLCTALCFSFLLFESVIWIMLSFYCPTFCWASLVFQLFKEDIQVVLSMSVHAWKTHCCSTLTMWDSCMATVAVNVHPNVHVSPHLTGKQRKNVVQSHLPALS